jgi:hypothetical protein
MAAPAAALPTQQARFPVQASQGKVLVVASGFLPAKAAAAAVIHRLAQTRLRAAAAKAEMVLLG